MLVRSNSMFICDMYMYMFINSTYYDVVVDTELHKHIGVVQRQQ